MSWTDIEKTNTSSEEKVPYTKFEQGATMIRVLDKEPYSFWNHWLPKQGTSVVCMGKGCPICGVIAEQKANKLEKIYSSTQRHAMRIWNYNTNKMEIMIQGKTFFSQLLTIYREVGDLTDFDLKIIRNGSDTSTTYTILPKAMTAFEHQNEVTEVDMAEVFKAPEKDVYLQLMEGKTYAEIYGTEE